jgi:hypothetical protein
MMTIVLVVLSILALVASIVFPEVALAAITVAVLLAIYAMLSQASDQHEEVMQRLDEIKIMLTPQYVERTQGELPPSATSEKPELSDERDLRRMVDERQSKKKE